MKGKKGKSKTIKMLSEKEFRPKWTEDCQSSFEQLKEKLVNVPILGYPNFKLSFRVEIDACLDGLIILNKFMYSLLYLEII